MVRVSLPMGGVGLASKLSLWKIFLLTEVVVISSVASIIVFTNISDSEAYTNLSILDPANKVVQIEARAVSQSSSAILDKWSLGSTGYTKVQAVELKETPDKYVKSSVNNDHQTFNFEKINFPSETTINKIVLVATAARSGTQTTKMSLSIAKGTSLSDLPSGGIPMTNTYVEYTRDVTNNPFVATPTLFTLAEVKAMQSGGSPLTFGVAQNTDGKEVKLTKLALLINFKDNTMPTSSASGSCTAGNNGWCKSDDTEQITATDAQPGAGVKEIHYILDGGSEIIVTGSSTNVAVTGDLIHTLEFWSVDNVGNVQLPHNSKQIKIDKTPPTISVTLDRVPDWNGWYSSAVISQYQATDLTSGVASCDPNKTYSGPDSSSVTGPAGTCTDNAGNSASASASFKYDATPPTVSASLVRDPDSNGWYNHAVDTKYIGSDLTSGVAKCDANKPYDDPDSASAVGPEGVCEDNAGNTASAIPPSFKYDDNAPITAAIVSRDPDSGSVYTYPVDVSLSCTDPGSGSGCNATTYTFDGISATYSGPISVNTSGVHTIVFHSNDKANNIEVDQTLQIEVQAANVSITTGPFSDYWNKQLTITGGSTGTVAGNKISVDWADGNTDEWNIGNGGSWTANHTYGPGNGARNVVAQVVNSNHVGISPTASVTITLLKRPTVINLLDIVDPTQGGDIRIGGNLKDQLLNSAVLTGTTISFQNEPEVLGILFTQTLNDGSFEAIGTAPPGDGDTGKIRVKFYEDDYYQSSGLVEKTYTVQYSPGGIGADKATVADIADLITYDTTLTDSDRDGIPDDWETNGIPYTCATGTCRLVLQDSSTKGSTTPTIGTSDVYVEIDGFANHVNSAAIDAVDKVFSDTHLDQIRPANLHYTLSDTNIVEPASPNPYVTNLWRDTDTNRVNDHDSIKANYFGLAADRVTFSGTQTYSGNGAALTLNGANLLLSSPGGGAYDSSNKVYGTVYLKTRVGLSAAPTGTITQSSFSCSGSGSGLTVTDASIVNPPSNGPTSKEKIITTKIKFQTTGQITNIPLGSCTVNLSIPGSPTISSVVNENVSPVIFTEKQLAKLKVYRYVLFVHSIGGPSGRSEIWGNDAVIALGDYTNVGGHAVGSKEEQAGTFMHELGHMLNLDHGGARWAQPTDLASPQVLGQSAINCKPNYVSLLSYSRQLPNSYLNQASVGGNGGWQLDYSSGKLAPLDEKNLKEANGLVSSDGPFTNGQVTISQGISPVYSATATFTNSGNAGLDANTELSAFSGAQLTNFVTGPVTITKGSTSIGATFTDSGSTGLNVNTELTGFKILPRIVYGTPTVSPYYKGGNFVTLGGVSPPVLSASAADISWDGDADATEPFTNTTVDINNFGIYGCQASTSNTSLSDSNDWKNLDFRIGQGTSTGSFGDGESRYELNTLQKQQIEIANANFIIIPPPAVDGQEVRNKGSQLPIKIDLQNYNGEDITYATIYAEYYTNLNPSKISIGSATYNSSVGHYAIPWKTPRVAAIYYVNVYIENPIPTSDQDRRLVNPTNPLVDNTGQAITIRVTLT